MDAFEELERLGFRFTDTLDDNILVFGYETTNLQCLYNTVGGTFLFRSPIPDLEYSVQYFYGFILCQRELMEITKIVIRSFNSVEIFDKDLKLGFSS